MVDSAVITMLDKIGNPIGDFELPLRIPMKELEKNWLPFSKQWIATYMYVLKKSRSSIMEKSLTKKIHYIKMLSGMAVLLN